jgi:Xaa-Pro dipeptidase
VIESGRLAALLTAERKAEALLHAIESQHLVRPGRTQTGVDEDIYTLAEQSFGVKKHLHKRIVRSGPNTVYIFAENPPVREIAAGDTVFLDLGPVFDEWEADVGRTYVMGDDPERQRLCQDCRGYLMTSSGISTTIATSRAPNFMHTRSKEAAGWLFGGVIAGHIVGEFPHARIPGDKDLYRLSPSNPGRMRDRDALGQMRHWIIESYTWSTVPELLAHSTNGVCNQRTWTWPDRVNRRGAAGR